MSKLDFSEFPDLHDPHRCGTSPFVPNVDDDRQNSCGSYSQSFNENGCSKYRPNYPDDLYLLEHGCEGLGDCYDGVPPPSGKPQGLPAHPDNLGKWPATGFQDTVVQGKNLGLLGESFSGGGNPLSLIMWVIVIYMLFKLLTK